MSTSSLPVFVHKQGDSFYPLCTYEIDGVPINLTSIDIASKIKMPDGTLVAICTLEKLDQSLYPGKFRPRVDSAQTQSWPVTRFAAQFLLWDIQYSQSGIVGSTDTLRVRVDQDVT